MAKTTAKGSRSTASGKGKPVKKTAGKPTKKAPPAKAPASKPKPKPGTKPSKQAPAGKPLKSATKPTKKPAPPPAKPAASKPAASKPAASKKAPPPKPSSAKAPSPAGKPAAPPPKPSAKAPPTKPLPPPKASQKPAAAPGRPAAAPPAKPSKKGEALTLVPARSSSPGSAPPRGRTGSSPPPRREGGVTLVRRQTERPGPNVTQAVSLPIPVRKIEAAPTVEERYAGIEKRLEAQPAEFQADYWARFDKSWIYHDSALEGSVYTLEELGAGLGDQPVVTDSSLQPAADEIRRHKEAIEFIRDAAKKKVPITIDVIKKVYLILHPAEGDIKTVKYRRDIPQHRLYFHEYAQPDKIGYKVRQVVDWLNDPETRKTRNAIRIAARAHYDLLRVFPFPSDSGTVARLFMNLLLMRSGHPPAIIHATERQRYYDALKGEPNIILKIVQESVENSLSSVEKILDEHETKARGFVS